MPGHAGDPAHDGGDLLAALGFHAFDQVAAGGFVEGAVVAVVGFPDAAACRIDLFVDAGDGVAAGEFGEAVLAAGEDAGAGREASGGGTGALPCDQVGEAPVAFSAHLRCSFNYLRASCRSATQSTPSVRNRSAWLGQVRRISVSTSALTPLR